MSNSENKRREYILAALPDIFAEVDLCVSSRDISDIAAMITDHLSVEDEASGVIDSHKGWASSEINRLEEELKYEREKVVCDRCGGSGAENYTAHGRRYSSTCTKCRGRGIAHPSQ